MNNDRLQYIKNYYENQKIRVEFPVFRSVDSKGHTVIYRFTGRRVGVDFNNGVATVDQAQLAALKDLYPDPNFLITHENTRGDQ